MYAVKLRADDVRERHRFCDDLHPVLFVGVCDEQQVVEQQCPGTRPPALIRVPELTRVHDVTRSCVQQERLDVTRELQALLQCVQAQFFVLKVTRWLVTLKALASVVSDGFLINCWITAAFQT